MTKNAQHEQAMDTLISGRFRVARRMGEMQAESPRGCTVRVLDGLEIAGADLVEVSPPLDPTGVTALAGATLMFELLCVMAGRSGGRASGKIR